MGELKKFGPSDFQRQVERLQSEGRMPSLDELLSVVAQIREVYRPLILAARRKARSRDVED
jgi:hypothetical protein